MIFLCGEEERELCPPDIGQVHLIIHQPVAQQRHSQDADHSQPAQHDGLTAFSRQLPGPQSHEQRRGQPVDARQGIARAAGRHHEEAAIQPFVRNRAETPEQSHRRRRTYRSHKEVAVQFQYVYPVAQVHIRQQQQRHGRKQHHSPVAWRLERFLHQQQQHEPPAAQQAHTQPRIVQELSKPHPHPCQKSACNNRLLLQEHHRVQEQIHLLHLPQLIPLKEKQRTGDDPQCDNPNNDRNIFFHL